MSQATISNGEEINLSSGTWAAHANMTSGTANLQISVGGGAFSLIEGTDRTATGGGIIEVPDCKVRADTTGDAVYILAKINNR